MNALIENPRPKRPTPNLILHCGARAVDRQQVITVPTPRATSSWTPIPHIELVSHVEHTITSNGLVVGTQAHSLSHDGMRCFGLMQIQRAESDQDYCWVLGLRNSHDKTFPAGIVAGSSVFCCDNLASSGSSVGKSWTSSGTTSKASHCPCWYCRVMTAKGRLPSSASSLIRKATGRGI
jgi:hypothetical protein